MKNVIKFEIEEDTSKIIKKVSNELAISISDLLREVLKKYKSENLNVSKKNILHCSKEKVYIEIRPTEEVTKQEYDVYAENISDVDILRILNEIY